MQQDFGPSLPSQANFSPDLNQPQTANIPAGQERQNNWMRSVSRGHQIKQAAKTVIKTREDLANYLKQNGGLQLLTSSVEFQQSGDFIMSSYVVYPEHNNIKEPLSQFLNRYEFLKEVANKINESLRPTQGGMQVITKRRF